MYLWRYIKRKGDKRIMKKKLVMVTLSLVMAISAITGCGKSDEEKARDEIMSHMDADEKANIAADQKEIEEWETEQQEKRKKPKPSKQHFPIIQRIF